jgi:prepilin-type N-terminal cleavage/methylation domain-containing protein
MTQKIRGFTLIELLITIAVIAILAALLFPVLSRAREKARESSCLNHQRQVIQGLHLWAQDHNERLPDTDTIWESLNLSPGTFVCPSKGGGVNGLVYNSLVADKTLAAFRTPEYVQVIGDGGPKTSSIWPNIAVIDSDFDRRHSKRFVLACLDGHTGVSAYSNFAPPPGAEVWLKADALTVSSGQPVDTWPDSSRQPHPATRTSGSPRLRTGVLNGKAAVQFTGNDILRTDALSSGTKSLFAVIALTRLAPASATPGIVTTQAAGESNHASGLALYQEADTFVLAHSGAALTLTSTNPQRDGVFVLAYSRDDSVSGANPLTLGAFSDDSNPFVGLIAEILLYPGELAKPEVEAVLGYLRVKYNL